MAELVKTRCTAGWLIVTESAILIELNGFGGVVQHSETMLRTSFTGVQMKRSTPFGLKSATMNLTFSGTGGTVMRANLVKTADAQKIVAILTGKE